MNNFIPTHLQLVNLSTLATLVMIVRAHLAAVVVVSNFPAAHQDFAGKSVAGSLDNVVVSVVGVGIAVDEDNVGEIGPVAVQLSDEVSVGNFRPLLMKRYLQ